MVKHILDESPHCVSLASAKKGGGNPFSYIHNYFLIAHSVLNTVRFPKTLDVMLPTVAAIFKMMIIMILN